MKRTEKILEIKTDLENQIKNKNLDKEKATAEYQKRIDAIDEEIAELSLRLEAIGKLK